MLEEKNGNYPGGIQINSNRDRGEQNEKEARGFFFWGDLFPNRRAARLPIRQGITNDPAKSDKVFIIKKLVFRITKAIMVKFYIFYIIILFA